MSNSLAIKLVATALSFCFLMFGLVSCDEDEPEPPGPSITGFNPAIGLPGTVVTISGTNFDATPSNNTVKFSTIVATVNEATETSLKVVVPADVVTGKIEVTVNGKSAVSAADFVVPPVITDFTPKSGVAGSVITITGKGFSPTATNNVVKINGVVAVVSASGATSLNVVAPANGTSGKISITVGAANVESTEIFKYIPAITSFAPLQGPVGSNVTITGSGFHPDVAGNEVKIGDVEQDIVSASVNELVIEVAEGTQTGNISVASGGSVATSSTPFTIIVEAWRAGSADFESGYSIGVDGSGNSYITGSFIGSVSFGSTILTGTGEELFVAKYNPAGELVWAVSAGGSAGDRGNSIVVDNAGNSYITGYYSSVAQFGTLTTPSAIGYDVFVAKLNSDGNFQWVQGFGSSNTDTSSDIAFDEAGNPVVTGQFFETINVGASEIESPGGASTFVAKFNKNTGSAMWAKSFGGTLDDSGAALSVNSGGDIYVTGNFFGTVTLGSNSFTTTGGTLNSFILKLDNLGTVIWAKHLFGNGWNTVFDVVTDAAGNCIATGYFTSNVLVGTTTLNAVNNEDLFLIKLKSTDGDMLFAKRAGGYGFDRGNGVALDADGNIFVTGYFEGDATFDNNNVSSGNNNNRDVFVTKYDPNGNSVWAKSAGGSESDFGNDVSVTGDDMIYLTGSFRDFDSTFGATVLENEGGDDVFVFRISQ